MTLLGAEEAPGFPGERTRSGADGPGFQCEREQDVPGLLGRVQAHVFPRRLRVKDRFRDFDPLRSGRCTSQQFARGVNLLVPTLPEQDVSTLVEHFSEPPEPMRPHLVNYQDFARAVDHVFVTPELEQHPTLKVPRPGSSLGISGARPAAPAPEQTALGRLLQRLALLTQTRGIMFKACFRDCERSDAASVLCPRNSGKVTRTQFLQYFPFRQDVKEEDLELLISHYATESGDVHYLALHDDMEALLAAAEAGVLPPRPAALIRPAATSRQHQREDPAHEAEATLEKVRNLIAERRLPLHGLFQDFDRLRHGVCQPGQAATVLSILNIGLTGRELDALTRMFIDRNGLFNYRDLCLALTEPLVPSVELPSTISGGSLQFETPRLSLPPPPRSARGPRSAGSTARLEAAEERLARRLWQRRLTLKGAFQDFDPVRTGRVTRQQFHRIVSMSGVELSPGDADVLCDAYCDPLRGEFRYLELCAALEKSTTDLLAAGPLSARSPAPSGLLQPLPGRSKYFDRSGRVVPLRSVALRPMTR